MPPDNVAGPLPLLRLKAVSRHFGGLTAIDGVSLDVVAGTRHAVIGPNGAGKTTLINLIAGPLRPTTGTVTFDGRDITRLSTPARARHGIGRSFQHPAVFGRLTVTDNLALAHRTRAGGDRPPRRCDPLERAARMVDDAGLADYATVLSGQLPYGLQRRLELAMALAARPRLLLLDEPSAGLDPHELTHLTHLITTHAADLTVLLVDHNLDLIWTLADTVTVLHHGRHLATAPPDVIRADPQVQAAYLSTGDPPSTPRLHHTRPLDGPALLRVRQLIAGYHGAPVVTGIDLDVHQGEAVAVLGRNGAGKTTLLNAIAGLLVPAPGSHIELAGRSLSGGRPHHPARAGLAIVPQGRRLFTDLTVTEHLISATAAHRNPPANTDWPWTVDRIWTLLPALADRAHHPAQLLSGGEQQMLALARALLTQPRLLILDEPSEGLAPAVIAQLATTLTDLVAAGLAVLIAEQNLALAATLTDRFLVLNRGRIAMAGPTRQLGEPTHRHRLHSLLGVTHPADRSTPAGPQPTNRPLGHDRGHGDDDRDGPPDAMSMGRRP